MTPRQKLLLGGLAVTGGLAAFFATTKTAKAAPLTPSQPSQPSTEWPADNMPWMMYSVTTRNRQQSFNAWATSNGFNTISVDGVLGPETCGALSAWVSFGGPELPTACFGHPTAYTSGGTDYGYGTRL